ncbi:hypothetical protein C8J57DRAFT_1527499 [Mycena rebaudengoi]|nr:hypothetical protein C8J57DRAFT_1527499 [Mycena rebaudengoi]
MPVVRNVLPYRKSRRLRQADPKIFEDDEMWETYDDALLTPQSDANIAVKAEPEETSEPPRLLDPLVLPHTHIPRPRNAFICFRSHYVRQEKRTAARVGPLDQTVLSCGAADVWRGMDTIQRLPYVQMAQEEKKAHTLKYPNYRYSPGTGGAARKPRKPKAKRASSVSSDESDAEWDSRASISSRGSSRQSKTSTRRTSRKKSISTAPRRRRTSSVAVSEVCNVDAPVIEVSAIDGPAMDAAVATSAEDAPVVDVPTLDMPTLSPAPISPTEDSTKKVEDSEPQIQRSSARPSSWDSIPTQFGFKEGISPTVIDSLTLSHSSSPSLLDMAELSLSDRNDFPVPSAPWDDSIYAPLEMHDDTLDFTVQFGEVAHDFGFFHPWNLDGAQDTSGF